MTPTYRVERDRGSKEFPQQLAVLRERWPLAFPTEHEDVRPLAMGAARQVAAAMDWSLPYTLGVRLERQSRAAGRRSRSMSATSRHSPCRHCWRARAPPLSAFPHRSL
jgi:hypothetical protein